jgi:hypothetical protein
MTGESMTLPIEKSNRLRYDGVETYLGLQLAASEGATTVTFAGPLLHDGGIPIPSFSYGDPDYLTLSILTSNYVLSEIVYLVAYDSGDPNVGTITRAEEGTRLALHSVGDKVVHSATAVDYGLLEDHINDPDAHRDVIELIAQAIADEAVRLHEAKPDPHPQYLKKPSETGNTIVIEAGQILHIKYGATLLVEGDLRVENTGRFFLNGKQIIVSNAAPTTPQANTVWIQTFG